MERRIFLNSVSIRYFKSYGITSALILTMKTNVSSRRRFKPNGKIKSGTLSSKSYMVGIDFLSFL